MERGLKGDANKHSRKGANGTMGNGIRQDTGQKQLLITEKQEIIALWHTTHRAEPRQTERLTVEDQMLNVYNET